MSCQFSLHHYKIENVRVKISIKLYSRKKKTCSYCYNTIAGNEGWLSQLLNPPRHGGTMQIGRLSTQLRGCKEFPSSTLHICSTAEVGLHFLIVQPV